MWIRRRIYCDDYNIWVKQKSKLRSILISILRYIHKHRFCYAKPNQTRRIVPGNRNKQWRNEFKAENSNKDLPKVVNKKHQTGEWGMLLGYLTNELSKSFPAKNASLWSAQSRKPELQSNGPRSFDCGTVSIGQANVKTLKDMLLNMIVIAKNCSTSVKSPGLRQYGLGIFTIGFLWG